MWNARPDESQAGINISGRNISNLRYADDTILMSESKKGTEESLEGERGEWKTWLKTQHLKNKVHVKPWLFHFNAWQNSLQ